jgi:2-polyprenyl-3-methyl-5-hydroxy-6-metoxy-1,4-benzoquinol methylase
MRYRLRDHAEVDYQVVRNNSQWWEHRARTLATAGLIAFLEPNTVLDLACGDGSVVLAAHRLRPISHVTFCDISEPSIESVSRRAREHGLAAAVDVHDAEERLDEAIEDGEHWDMVLLCEFLEHIEDPVAILRKAAQVATILVASSPIIDLPRGDPNEEHVWAFDNEGYLELFAESGWQPRICENLMLHEGYYNFQMWVCGHG